MKHKIILGHGLVHLQYTNGFSVTVCFRHLVGMQRDVDKITFSTLNPEYSPMIRFGSEADAITTESAIQAAWQTHLTDGDSIS